MRFREPMDCAGLSVASSVTATDQSNRRRHQLWFVPLLRHFRVEFYPGADAPALVSYVHESLIKSWEPIE